MLDYIIHTGVGHDDGPPGRGSGRYGWGTGSNPGQHTFDFLTEVSTLKKRGLSESEIAKTLLGDRANSTTLRAEIAIQKANTRKINIDRASKLLTECKGNVSEVARIMGKNESTIRTWLDPVKKERATKYENTANKLKEIVKNKGMIDVSKDSELYLGITDDTKKVALSILEKEGYVRTYVKVPQMGTNHETTIMVLAPPGTKYSDIQKNKYNIKPIQEFTPDQGKTWFVPEFPESIDSKRVQVRYAEEGGKDKDGVIELRKGVEDISLGGSRYSQVRIAVDGTHYMKGMAIYSDNMPDGVDIIYNTNKHKGTPMIGEKDHEVLKRMKIDKATGEVDRDNPFGATIKSPKERDGIITAGGQRHYIGKDGKEHLSPINKLQDEGDWDSWSRNLSSQFLSKQPIKLINQQIDISIKDKINELDKINNLTNPVIKKKMLEDFANGCDAKASSLSVKGFKNQAFQVLIPIPGLKDNEIYAPNYSDGDTVALVRYPHGGTFEIPVLKVNNKHKQASSVMGKNAKDAIGINSNVAERLSGADFDGDTALVIPVASNRLNIKSTPPLKGLEGFDPKELYKLPDSAPRMANKTKQNEMGRVSNLITDMTVGGANPNEIAQAVKHSMVVIDAEKHHLDYKQSEKDNNITYLKKKYQGITPKGTPKGASTILSKASSQARIPQRKEITDVKKMTPEELKRWNEGKRVYRPTGETKIERITNTKKMTPDELKAHNAGKKVYRRTNKLKEETVSKMDIVDDATELVRDKSNPKEMAYANYANQLKALANKARQEYRGIKPTPVSKSARSTYAKEVESLNRKLAIAKMNSPRERQAQVIANSIVSEKFHSNPDMDFEHKQKERARALAQARAIVGAKKDKIVITDSEWDAIQANAISTNKLTEILNNTDQELFKKRATPKSNGTNLSTAQLALIKSMLSSGMYTQKEIADRLGVSTSTISNAVK